jgi:hypothetical protein
MSWLMCVEICVECGRKNSSSQNFGGGRNNLLFRKYVAGAYIKIGEYNKETEFG